MRAPDRTELRCRSLDGMVFFLRVETMAEYFTSDSFTRFVLLVVAAIVALVGAVLDADQGVDFEIVLVAVLAVTLIATMMVWCICVGSILMWFYRRDFIRTIHTPLFTVFAVVPVIGYGLTLHGPAAFFTGFASVQILWLVVLLVCIDVFHCRYVAPSYPGYFASPADGTRDEAHAGNKSTTPQAANRVEKTEAERPAPKQDDVVSVGKHSFRLAAVKVIRAEDIYVYIELETGNLMVRESLSHVVGALPMDAGVQVTRSVWLPFSEFKTLEDAERGRLVLTTRDGEMLSVPQTRKIIVAQGFAAYRSRSTLQDVPTA